MKEVKDFAGNVLAKGDFIVYPFKMFGHMRFAKVLGIREKILAVKHYRYPTGIQMKLAVQPVSVWLDEKKIADRYELQQKVSIENFTEVFQIERCQVPVEVQKLLDGVPVDKN